MRTLAIRYWLIVALGVYFLCAVSPFVIIGTWVCAYEKPAPYASS